MTPDVHRTNIRPCGSCRSMSSPHAEVSPAELIPPSPRINGAQQFGAFYSEKAPFYFANIWDEILMNSK